VCLSCKEYAEPTFSSVEHLQVLGLPYQQIPSNT
jgi:hypothetical protein